MKIPTWLWIVAAGAGAWYFFFYKKGPEIGSGAVGGAATSAADKLKDAYIKNRLQSAASQLKTAAEITGENTPQGANLF